MSKFPHGVLTNDLVQEVFEDAKKKQYALPAVNVTNTSTVNSVLEAAAELNSPAIIQFSNGGCQFFAGKGLSNENQLLQLQEEFLAQIMFMKWLNYMELVLFFTQIIVLENYYLGLMVY